MAIRDTLRPAIFININGFMRFSNIMVRNCARKSPAADAENIKKAVHAVKNEHYSERQAAIKFGIERMALNHQWAPGTRSMHSGKF